MASFDWNIHYFTTKDILLISWKHRLWQTAWHTERIRAEQMWRRRTMDGQNTAHTHTYNILIPVPNVHTVFFFSNSKKHDCVKLITKLFWWWCLHLACVKFLPALGVSGTERGYTEQNSPKDTAALLIFFLLVLGAIIFVFFLMYHPLLGDGFSHLFFSSKAFLPAELSLLIV